VASPETFRYTLVYRTITLPEVCLLLYRKTVSENRVLRRMFGHKEDKYGQDGEHYITKSFIICPLRGG
jgi:hypothetical protein